MTDIEADTIYPCPFCGELPHIVIRDDKKCGIYCGNDDCPVSIEVKEWWDNVTEAQDEWDNAILVLINGGFRFE